jgi:hypothetical protein
MANAETLFELTFAVNKNEPVGSIAAEIGLPPATV